MIGMGIRNTTCIESGYLRNRYPAWRLCAAVLLPACVALGQSHKPACTGPAELEHVIATHPTAAAYDALGAYFGKHQQLACALNAFHAAVRIDPRSWEARYDLALALLQHQQADAAANELRTAATLKPGDAQTQLALGIASNQAGRSEQAEDAFRQVLKTQPNSVAALAGLTEALLAEKRYTAVIDALKDAPQDEVLQLNLAIAYSKNNDLDRAFQILAAIVQQHPDYAQAHLNLGILYTQQSRYREAASEFEQALKIDPNNNAARASCIKSLIILGQMNDALPMAQEHLRRNPKDPEALYLLGAVQREQGNYAEAEHALAKAVALQPNFYDSRYDLGFVLAKLGRRAEARTQLEQALKLRPDSSEARFQLASVLRAMGLKEQADEQLKLFQQGKSASVSQDVAGVKVNQANQYLSSGDAQKAIALYREAISADPKNGRTYYDLALALDRTGDIAAERDALEKSMALDAQFAPTQNQYGLLCLQAGDLPTAETHLKQAIALDPQYAEAQSNLGVLYGRQGNNAEAEKLFRHATEDDPKYTQAFVNLGLILASEGRFPEAHDVFQHALSLDANNTGAMTADAFVQVRMNRTQDALAEFRKVIALSPQSPAAHLNLGLILADEYKQEQALAEFTTASELAPNDATAHYNRGRVLLDMQRNQEARPELEKATALDPRTTDAWYLLGLIARQSGDTDEAIRDFQRAVALKPDYAEAHFMLGRELQRKGDPAGAAAEWRKAIQIHPDYSEALYNLARLTAKTDPAESAQLQSQFDALQARKHVMDRAQTLGNFALASADAHDWPQAISQLQEGIKLCKDCSALPLLHKDLGLIYCRLGELENGKKELLIAQQMAPSDPDIQRALKILASMEK